jgi:hypothetical protein
VTVHRDTMYYMASVLDLPPAAVARVNGALGDATDTERLLWWMNPCASIDRRDHRARSDS